MIISAGTLLGPYKILAFIGKGGMGEVYQAKDERLGRDVAIKVLPKETSHEPDALKRLNKEAKALAALSNPNIVTIHDVGTEQNISFLVMELLSGETLRSRIVRSTISWKNAVNIAIQVTNALSAAHSKGIIHRDLKPENIFLTSDGAVKVLDFGLAISKPVLPEQQKSYATTISEEANKISGTFPYMSPEQLQGASLDARSDIFSFGCVFYEMVYGNKPFLGSSAAEIIAGILKEDPTKSNDSTKIPPELEHIIFHCLEKNPNHRFQSAADLSFNLREVLTASSGGESEAHLSAASEKHPLRVLSVLLTIPLLVAIGWWFSRKSILTHKARDRTIAVLPFKNLSPDKDSEYFSDGITEDVVAQLSKIGQLRVLSRTSIMRYKNSAKSLQEIGKELNVANVLEGSVRRDGNRIRIVGQLIDAQTDEHIWAETYDREMNDIFEIQTDVALQIARALKTKLTAAEKENIQQKPTLSVTAYDYYLKARQFYGRYNKQDNENAIQLFKRAVETDPKYALAYSGLGHAYMRRLEYGYPKTSIDLAKQASDKAIALDPDLADAYDLLHKIYGYKGYGGKSFDAILKAAQLNPIYGINLSVEYVNKGNLVKAMDWINKAITVDPSQAFPYMTKGMIYYYLDDLPTAKSYYLKSLELQPDFPYPHAMFVEFYLAQEMPREAKKHAEKLVSLSPTSDSFYYMGLVELISENMPESKKWFQKSFATSGGDWGSKGPIYFAYVLRNEGLQKESDKILAEQAVIYQRIIDEGSDIPLPRMNLASIYAIKGKKAEALKWLQDSIDAGDLEFRMISVNPLFEILHGDAQYQKTMVELKSKIDAMRKRITNH